MDKLRDEENAEYLSNKADMQQGLEGIKAALKVLRAYYAKGDKTASEGAGTGIIGLLEVCESDLSKSLADIETTEASAKAKYEEETKDNEIEKTNKEQDVKYKSKESTGLDKAVAEASADRTEVQVELDAVNDYLKKL